MLVQTFVHMPKVGREFIARQRPTVNAKALLHIDQMRRTEEARSDAAVPQNGLGLGACGALALRTGHMNDGESVGVVADVTVEQGQWQSGPNVVEFGGLATGAIGAMLAQC